MLTATGVWEGRGDSGECWRAKGIRGEATGVPETHGAGAEDRKSWKQTGNEASRYQTSIWGPGCITPRGQAESGGFKPVCGRKIQVCQLIHSSLPACLITLPPGEGSQSVLPLAGVSPPGSPVRGSWELAGGMHAVPPIPRCQGLEPAARSSGEPGSRVGIYGDLTGQDHLWGGGCLGKLLTLGGLCALGTRRGVRHGGGYGLHG